MVDTDNPYIIKSVTRCFSILERIASAAAGEATPRGLSRCLGIPETTTVKILRSLESRSFIERDTPAGPYRLGCGTLMLHEACLQHQRRQKLRDLRPFLEELACRTGETAYLARFSADGAVCEESVESDQAVRVVCRKGLPLPPAIPAAGKVMLAYAKGAVQYRREIEDRGFVVSAGEPDVTGIAVPVRNHAGAVTAVIGVAGPACRLGLERAVDEVAPVVVRVASAVSRRLGYQEPLPVPRLRLVRPAAPVAAAGFEAAAR